MRATLQNLEQQEAIVNRCFVEGEKLGTTMREALYRIKDGELWKALGDEKVHNLETYLRESRLKVSYETAKRLSLNGEIEHRIGKGTVVPFSDRALRSVHTIREEVNGKKTNALHFAKIKKVLTKATALAAKAGEPPTEKHIQQAKESVLAPPAPVPLGEQLQARLKQANTLLSSLEELEQLDAGVFQDAERQNPGVCKRLAKSFVDLATFLRRVS